MNNPEVLLRCQILLNNNFRIYSLFLVFYKKCKYHQILDRSIEQHLTPTLPLGHEPVGSRQVERLKTEWRFTVIHERNFKPSAELGGPRECQ